MLYLLHGQDTLKGKRKLIQILDFFRAKVGNLGIFRLDGDEFNLAELEELLKSQTLFEKKYVVVCDRTLGAPGAEKFVSDNIEKFASSPHVFIFFEEEVGGEIFDLFKKNAEKVQEFKKSAPAAEKYNPFPICDAFAAKDKKRLWILFQKALHEGVPAEEIFWKIWWQTKNLLMIKNLSDRGAKNIQKESGLHPFVAKKTVSALRNFAGGELAGCSARLVELYRDSRDGEEEMPAGLEKFFLNL